MESAGILNSLTTNILVSNKDEENEDTKITKEEKNFRRMNKLDLRHATPRPNGHKVIDSRDGHVQIADRSGLEPVYLFKTNFGESPAYIRKIRNDVRDQRDLKTETNIIDGSATHFVTDEERHRLLIGLKQNWAALQSEFITLPMLIDTVPKKRHKTKLENLLREIEKHIDLLERNPIIYVCQEIKGGKTADSTLKSTVSDQRNSSVNDQQAQV